MKKENTFQDEILDIWNLLAYNYRLIVKVWDNELRPYGFSREQALNLLIIKALGDKATPYSIARYQVQEKNTVSEILIRMEKQDLVIKIRESRGKSRVRVILTERGEQACQQFLQMSSLSKIMSRLSIPKRKQLVSSLEALKKIVLKEVNKDHAWPEILIPPSQW